MKLQEIVKLLTENETRIRTSTFELVCKSVPPGALTETERSQLSGMLAKAYQPPFYSSANAAKAAASQHAKAIWALSNGMGNRNSASIKEYLSSLK
jgi:hypothetical protein